VTDEFEPVVRRTGVDVVESSGAIHFQEGLTADGADLVRDGREGSTRLAVHHHQIQNLGQDPHLLVAIIVTPCVPALGAGVQAEGVACLKSEGATGSVHQIAVLTTPSSDPCVGRTLPDWVRRSRSWQAHPDALQELAASPTCMDSQP